MADVVVGCDRNAGNDQEMIDTVAKGLKDAGHNVVEKLSVGPGPFSEYGYGSNAKGKIGIYLMADSLFSFADGTHDLYDLDIFVIRGGIGGGINSQQDFETKPLSPDADCNSVCDEFSGLTYPQMNEKAQGKCVAIYGGTTPEEALAAALAALQGKTTSSGTTGNTTTTTGGSAVSIPDLTFYGLIKQIIGAIDGVFIIANNMAYLLSFKDLYKYRDLYEEYIPEIKTSDILIEGVTHNWTTDGLYNAVEITYADGIFRYQHDTLVEIYGDNTFYYDFPEDDEETAKAKAKALLSAHVRDYSLDIEIDCVYNPNITAGGWVKIPKTLTNLSTTTKQGPIKKLYKAPERKLRKGVNITNINETTQLIDEENITIQHVVTEDKEEYDIEIEKKDYEIYFVQGYRFRWTPKQAPIMHVHLKYGPDTPEDPVNATIGTGAITSGNASGVASGDAQYGDDCFGVEIAQLENDYRIPHSGEGGIEYATQNPPSAEMTAGRCKQGSKYQQEVAGKTPEEAYYIASSKFIYCYYGDNCEKYKCNEERWTSGECGFNCGDSATILKSVLDCVGQKNWIFHIDGHYHSMIEVDGKIQSVDLSRRSDEYTHTVGWPSAQSGSCGCACYSA